MKIFLTILVLLIVFISIIGNNSNHASLQTTSQQASSESMKKSLAAEAKALKIRNEKREKELAIQQPKLEKLIKSYANHGMFYKVEYSDGIPYVWINDVFNMLTIDNKNILLGIIYLYYHNAHSEVDRIYLRNAYTGKSFGNFRPKTGIIIY